MADTSTNWQYEKGVLVDRVNVREEVIDVISDVLSLSRHFDTTGDLQAIKRAKEELKNLIGLKPDEPFTEARRPECDPGILEQYRWC